MLISTSMWMPFDVRASLIFCLKNLWSTYAGNVPKYSSSKREQNYVKIGMKIFGFMS